MSNEPAWHARIESARQGSGFLIDDRHVLTCAHVVRDRADATVSFLSLGSDHPRRGKVVFRGPWTGGSEGDVAVVRLDEAVGLAPARLAPLNAVEIFAEQKLAAFGFPSGYTASGQISYFHAESRHRLAGRACQTTPVDDGGFSLKEGYSGSAAYVCGTDDVVGMVTSADRATSRAGVILPLDELHRQWPDIADRISLGPFGPASYRELREILKGVHLPDTHALHVEVVRGRTVPPPMPPHPLRSALAVVESLAVTTALSEEVVRDLVVSVLREVGKRVPERRAQLHDWAGRHGWGGDPVLAGGSVAAPPVKQGWVVVRIAFTGGSRRLYHLTIWTATGPEGELDEPILDQEVSRAKIQGAVERALPQAYARIPRSCETINIEFVLPRGLLGWEVDNWLALDDDQVPLGWSRPVVVRDLEWFDSHAPHEIEKRARQLRDHPAALEATMRWLDCSEPTREPRQFQAWLRQGDPPLALGLAGPWAGDSHIQPAVASGVPVLLWRRAKCDARPEARAACPGTRFRDDMVARLRGVRSDGLPMRIRELRAESGLDENPEHCGRDVTLLWDEPRRRPAALGFAE